MRFNKASGLCVWLCPGRLRAGRPPVLTASCATQHQLRFLHYRRIFTLLLFSLFSLLSLLPLLTLLQFFTLISLSLLLPLYCYHFTAAAAAAAVRFEWWGATPGGW